jgi:CheY-like chemotaxis protein
MAWLSRLSVTTRPNGKYLQSNPIIFISIESSRGILLILLISSNNTILKSVAVALPDSVTLVHTDTLAAARPYLNPPGNNPPEIILIILDATDGQAIVSTCRHMLCQSNSKENIPIIAIIAEAAARETVWAAGADDYLLQPLLSSEIKARLAIHLYSSLLGFDSLVETIHQVGILGSAIPDLNQRLKNLSLLFKATAAWLLLVDTDHKQVRLISSYNLPPLFQPENMILEQETAECLELLQANQFDGPQVVTCPYLTRADTKDTNGLTHHLTIPLNSRQRLRGVLNLGYTEAPTISLTEMRILTILGRDVGILLEMFDLQQ